MDRRIENESFTKAIYHLQFAKEYMDDFRRSAEMDAKYKAGLWLGKIKNVIFEVKNSITQASRERFNHEFLKGDLLFHEAIAQRYLNMTHEQRELLETLADHILSGEEIKVEKI